jgi:hypothetical protein
VKILAWAAALDEIAVLLVALVVGLAFNAAILRVACRLFNRLVGGPSSEKAVPIPSFGKAFGIMILTFVINSLAGTFFELGAASAGFQEERVRLAVLASLPLGVLILGWIASGLLPTRFSKALGVALIHFGIILVVLAAAVVAFLISPGRLGPE